MNRPLLDQDIRSLSDFRANATGFIQHVKETKRPIVITQHGKGAAVLLDVGEYEALLNRLELVQEIEIAEKQLSESQGVSHSAAKKRVLARLKK